jgi:hypothetical protein
MRLPQRKVEQRCESCFDPGHVEDHAVPTVDDSGALTPLWRDVAQSLRDRSDLVDAVAEVHARPGRRSVAGRMGRSAVVRPARV